MKIALYVQVVPQRETYTDTVYTAKAVKVTKRRPDPARMLPDAQLVKVELDVPAERFLMRAVQVEASEVPAIRAVS